MTEKEFNQQASNSGKKNNDTPQAKPIEKTKAENKDKRQEVEKQEKMDKKPKSLAPESESGKGNQITFMGLGGMGGRVLNAFIENEAIEDINYVAVNTDSQDLNANKAKKHVLIYTDDGHIGNGAGSKPEVGRAAAENCIEAIDAQMPDNTEMVFIAAGLGGGTGTGSAPVVAKKCKERGVPLTIGFFLLAPRFQGIRRTNGQKAFEELKEYLDCYIMIDLDDVQKLYKDQPIRDFEKLAFDMLYSGLKGIHLIATKPLDIENADFRDFETVLKDRGNLLMGEGFGKGEDAEEQAIEQALNSPLIRGVKLEGAKGYFCFVMLPSNGNTKIGNKYMIYEKVFQKTGENETGQNISASTYDDSLEEDEVRIILIVAGFERDITRDFGQKKDRKIEDKQEKTKAEKTEEKHEKEVKNGVLFPQEEIDWSKKVEEMKKNKKTISTRELSQEKKEGALKRKIR